MTPRFRPLVEPLEAREVPALNLLYTGASLTLTGTPTAAADQLLTVANVGGNDFRVTDGGRDLGTYRVTRDITLRLAGYDSFVGIDLNGATLSGNVLVDVGAGDRDPATNNGVSVGNNAGPAVVAGDVTFRGGAGTETFAVFADGGSTLDIGGNVRVTGRAVAAPVADGFVLAPQTRVHGDVVTTRMSFTTIIGAVDGDVTANAADSPGFTGFSLYGTVGGDVSVTGGTTAAGSRASAGVFGTVGGDVRFDLTGPGGAGFGGTVGGDGTVRHAGGGSFTTSLNGSVAGDLTVVTGGGTAADETALYVDYFVGGDLRFKQNGPAGSSVVYVTGYVAGDAAIDLGGPGTQLGLANLSGAIGGSAVVTGRSQTVLVRVAGFPGNGYAEFGVPGTTTVTGDLTVRLGNGNNTLDITQYDSDPRPATVGGKLTYSGGTGADVVLVSGRFAFRAKIDTGGGNDAVAFAPDAVVGALDLDFGRAPGTKAWTPPAVVAFPLKLKNLS